MLFFISSCLREAGVIRHSNTSHVILYRISVINKQNKTIIQIHLMLFFILVLLFFWHLPSGIQIHLMLFFIYSAGQACCIRLAFKYISCYSLSSAVRFSSSNLSNSNTSHVILYRCICFYVCTNCKFKYISCYSLSCTLSDSSQTDTKFKYISCYSLSC